MAEVILMPRLSDTMTEGIIADWHKNMGDIVKKGDLLAEVETDKATMELESYKDGVLLHIGTAKGGKLQVNDLLAIIGSEGEDITKLIAENSRANVESKQSSTEPEIKIITESKSNMDVSKMEEVVLMPRLSDTMEEGVIAGWHKNVGDTVKKGEVLADIETDKATMELESYKNGTLLYIGANQGEKILVNGLLCIIGEKGKVDVDAIVNTIKSGSHNAVKSEVAEQVISSLATVEASSIVSGSTDDGRIKVSPLAKKLAAEKGIDLKNVNGSGDAGRITKSDIDNFDASKSGSPAPQTASVADYKPSIVTAVKGEEGYIDTPNTQMRKTIAKRLGESKFSAPHFYLTMEINMDNAMAARSQMNEVSPVKISFQDMLIKASATALKLHPAVNSSWMDDFIRTYQHVHIGSAIALPDGLIVPVIRFADQKTMSQLSAESKELYDKARNKKLQPQEFSGNTFTISNLGMMDIDEFTAIVNPPDSCILAVGKIKEVVVRKGEGFGVTNVMKVTLSCDHRSVDGAVGAAFLQTLKKFMENPVTMLV